MPKFRLRLLSALALLGAAMYPARAHAVVVQIDGETCPTNNGANLQPYLNSGENGCALGPNNDTCYTNKGTPTVHAGAIGTQGPIDAVLDAGLAPETFAVPQVAGKFQKVTYVFLGRGGAGYRNTFGWYNVGNDFSTAAALGTNLHSVITCNPPTDGPDETKPSLNPVAGDSDFYQTVDFEAACLPRVGGVCTGAYKGGFIGFFLVTPEGQSGTCSTGNCGNPQEAACIGRVYFTERELNGDGNYVHNLVYQSKVTTDTKGTRANNYYFGFEDLYRGGDNDFKDVTMLVAGLLAPCVPTPEICDNKDNNCDGLVDNNPVDAGGPCSASGNLTPKGDCKAGTNVCTGGKLVCTGEILPVTESCDGTDNDCDGTIDNDPPTGYTPPLGNACGAPALGTCSAATQCVGGKPTCVPTTGPQPETCNGLDDDCDGKIDNNTTDVGQTCTDCTFNGLSADKCPTQGECHAGVTDCEPGSSPSDKLGCKGYKGPTPELCDGKDNDCDGLVDNNPTDLASSCTLPGGTTQVCGGGHETCVGGHKVCSGLSFPKPETCDGTDNDCDGMIDNNPVDVGSGCQDPVLAPCGGVTQCLPVTSGDPTTDKVTCVPTSMPSTELCNGIDDDCNGVIDDGLMDPTVGVACNTLCGAGVTICKDGMVQCSGTSGGTVEVCDGKDNDCDGLVDNNPIDAGGPCGTVVVDPTTQTAGACVQGTFQCVAKTPGDPSTDQLICGGEKTGSTEVCNGKDDNCNGIVDENVPGENMDCVPDGFPAGTMLPLAGLCKPGKTECVDGKDQCVGGIGPQAEQCDGLDHNCDGKPDSSDNGCTSPTKCISGACREPCSNSGEFDSCPPGQECTAGFCEIIDCSTTCMAGTTCNKTTGVCVANGAGGGSSGTGGKGSGGGSVSTGGNGSGGHTTGGGSGETGGANAGGGESAAGGGSNATGGSTSGSGANSGTGAGGPITITNPDGHFGLATGGGGCSTSTESTSFDGAGLALLGLVLARRRRRPTNVCAAREVSK